MAGSVVAPSWWRVFVFQTVTWPVRQISFYATKRRRHRLAQHGLIGASGAFFVVTVVFAMLHGWGILEEHAIFLTILLPAAGAAAGVLATVGQHLAMSERYERMESELTIRQEALCATTSRQGLAGASADAARVIVQETGDWLGAMWFLDIEPLSPRADFPPKSLTPGPSAKG
jgi:hypothetical protein